MLRAALGGLLACSIPNDLTHVRQQPGHLEGGSWPGGMADHTLSPDTPTPTPEGCEQRWGLPAGVSQNKQTWLPAAVHCVPRAPGPLLLPLTRYLSKMLPGYLRRCTRQDCSSLQLYSLHHTNMPAFLTTSVPGT